MLGRAVARIQHGCKRIRMRMRVQQVGFFSHSLSCRNCTAGWRRYPRQISMPKGSGLLTRPSVLRLSKTSFLFSPAAQFKMNGSRGVNATGPCPLLCSEETAFRCDDPRGHSYCVAAPWQVVVPLEWIECGTYGDLIDYCIGQLHLLAI